MKEKFHMLAIDNNEQNIIIAALDKSRTKEIEEGRSEIPFCALILKTAYAPSRKIRGIDQNPSY